MKSRLASRPFVLAVSIAIAAPLFGCSAKRSLSPIEYGGVSRSGHYYQVKSNGLTIAVEPMSWKASSKNLENRLLPVWVAVVNGSEKTISVRRDQFTLLYVWLTNRRVWNPVQLYLMFNSPGFSLYYFGPFPFFWLYMPDEHYHTFRRLEPRHREWDGGAPLDDSVRLPERDLEPGESIRGVLLFNVGGRQDGNYILRWKPEGVHGVMEIRFSIMTS